MKPELWAEIDRLFNGALDLPPAERERHVREHATDGAVADRVLLMLEATESEHPGFDAGLPVAGLADALGRAAAPRAREAPFLPSGYRLGPFRIEHLIATGGMGAVYAAARADGEVRQRVAIKLLRTRPGAGARPDGETARRFLLERQVLASLRHPSITSLLDVGATEDGRPYLVMELVDGVPIDVYCRERALSDRAIAGLVARVCDAAQHAHQSLVLHRDLKPQNILVGRDGTPKVLDFGVARLLAPDDDADRMNTRSGEFLGTLAYAAPEQLKGERSTDTRCDIYSLGVIMYRLLTGELPHGDSKSLPAFLERVERVRVTPPSKRRASISADIDAVVRRAMARDRERRYQSAGELAADLRRFAAGEPVQARADSGWYVIRSEIKRRRAPIAAAGAVIVASLGFAAVTLLQADRLRDRTLELEASLHANRFREGRLLGQSGNVAAAETMLWSCADAERANGALPALARWGLRELYRRHPVDATLGFPSGGAFVVGPAAGGAVYALDPTERALLSFDPAGGRSVVRSDFAPDAAASDETGETLAWVDPDGALRVARSGGPGRVVARGIAPGASIALSAGGRVVAALADGSLVCHGGGEAGEPWSIERGVLACAVSAGGRVFGICDDSTVREWGPDGGGEIGRWPVALAKGRRVLAADPSGELLAFASGSDLVLLRTATGERTRARAANGWVEAVCFASHADGTPLVAAASADYAVRFWGCADLDLVLEGTAHRDRPQRLFRIDGGDAVLSIDRGGLGRVWRPGSAMGGGGAALGTGTILNLAVHREGRLVLAGLDDHPPRAVRFDTVDGGTVAGPPSREPVSAVAWLPGDESCVAATYGAELFRLEHAGGALTRAWRAALGGPANTLAIAPDGSRVAVGCAGAVEIYRTEDGARVGRVELDALRTPMIRWRAGSIFAVLLPDSSIVRVDADTLNVESLLDDATAGIGLRAIDVSDDGELLAFAGDDALVRVWRRTPDGWAPRLELSGHRDGVFDLAFGPRGVLASGARDGTVLLWCLRSGAEIGRFDALRGMVFDVEFHGGRLFIGGAGAELRWIDTRAADGRVSRNRPPSPSVPHGS